MSQLERFRATMEHRPHDEFLFYASFTPDLERRMRAHLGLGPDDSIRERLDMFTPAQIALTPPANAVKPDFSHYFEGYERPADAFINDLGVLNIPSGTYHFTGYVSPLRNAQSFAELEAFSYPTVEGFTESGMAEGVSEAHERGLVAESWIGHMYEDSWQIRGYEGFLEDMMLRSEWCAYILDRLTERNITKAEAAARAGADLLRTGDDVANQNAMMFSIPMWREFMKKRWARVYEAARRIKPDIEIWYHSDGNIEPIIPELIDIGVTILNPVQPECVDLAAVKRRYGNHLVLDGTIGTQTTMPFGTPEEVRRVIADRKRELGSDGALIISPTHVLEPEVPIENVMAFVEAAGA